MLTEHTKTLVKATVPALEAHGTDITRVFYRNMFAAHPELLDIFNKTNQKQGKQQTALASAVLAAAKHIDNLGDILPHVVQISHKHRALQIKPEHYPIVGEHLLGAIKEVLGDAATPEIIAAWAEAYGAIADVFIGVEKEMYQEAAWPGFADFTVTGKRQVGGGIAEFTVKPADISLPEIRAGQYITVQVRPEAQGNLALRHYSICSTDISDGLKFAVKRDNGNGHHGLVSNYLHDHVNVGDTIRLSAPAGDFLWQNGSNPIVLISAGVGITPIMAMLEAQVNANPARKLVWVHAARNAGAHAFKQETEALLDKADDAERHILYREEGGCINAAWLEAHTPADADVYLCGSIGFMESIAGELDSLARKEQNVYFEPFGPKMSVVSV
ncbi:MAG: globin domain-containing protein [Neisseria sp.]|nr:globin domain-containing protein [Neisseria sp.]